jgi:hypothetical protein
MHLFAVPRATLLQYWEDISNTAQSMYTAENPAEGATFTYHLAKPAQKVRMIVRGTGGKVIRELNGPTSPNALHRVSWDLRHAPPPASAGAGGFGGEEGGGPPEAGAGGGRGGRARAEAVVQLPVPPHDIGLRGPYVAPGTYTVTLNVDGDTTSRTFEVRGDPAGIATLAQQKAREAFLVDVQNLQTQTEQRAADIRSRRASTTGTDSTHLVALERRLTGGRDGVRAKLGGVARFFNGTGAQQGSFLPPTTTQRQVVADAKAELVAVEKEMKSVAASK